MSEYYDIEGNPIEGVLSWAKLMDSTDRVIGKTDIDGTTVSTVWIGLDHSFGEGPPLIFETMVFGLDDENEWQWRYSTRTEAEAGHARVVERVKTGTLSYG